eukprot:2603857-Pyramimonas_sp.AAC.1
MPRHVSAAAANALTLRPRRKGARGHRTRIRRRYQDAAGLNLPGRMLALAHQFSTRQYHELAPWGCGCVGM